MHSNSDDPDNQGSVKDKKPGRFAGLFKRKTDQQPDQPASPEPTEVEPADVAQGLQKSRSGLLGKISNVFKGSFDLDDELFDELEEVLISCDIGVDASLNLVEQLRQRVKREKIQDADGVIAGLHAEITQLLQVAEQSWNPKSADSENLPYVMLIVGVNGVGKTTTTAKIAQYLSKQGHSVMLAAADTFRAAAVEQLQEWGQRMNIPVIAQQHGSDAAAVAHDALSAAIARKIDILIIDTAGRLHTQDDLMEQLKKVSRVLKKIDANTPHEVMQVLDAGTGQNALSQLKHFQQATDVSSISLSKLDGSAKGGVALALTQQFSLPIRFVGVGEGADDLRPFNAAEFANGLIKQAND